MLKHTIIFAAIAGLVLALAPAAASADITEVVPPAGGYPARYRLVFVTSATTDATNTGIGYYNTFVNNVANDLDGNTGSLVADLGATWRCFGSTLTDSVKANTNTYEPGDAGYDASNDVPIYKLDGVLLDEDGGNGYNEALWEVIIEEGERVDYNEQGTAYSWTDEVWTGTNNDGTVSSWPLGSAGDVTWTRAAQPGEQYSQNLMNHSRADGDESRHLYALSDPIPEPASAVLLLIGAPLLALRRRRR